jgi:hypothetical protein
MKKQLGILVVGISMLFVITSCDLLGTGTSLNDLSTEEVVAGLKKALVIGTDSSTNTLSTTGYYDDIAVRIPLPDEAEVVRQQIVQLSSVSGLSNVFDVDQEFENVVKSINMAAQESAKEAQPIFADAITGLSITDGWDILNGINPASTSKSAGFDSTAATGYFKITTHSALKELFAPKINLKLNEDLGLGFSANDAWTTLRNAINTTMNRIEGNYLLNLAYMNSGYSVNRIQQASIGDYATEKALDGLFLKVGSEERKIRNNPLAWADDLLQKVFGSVQIN